MKDLRAFRIFWLLCSVGIITMGIACIFFPLKTMLAVSYLAAIVMFSFGIGSIYYFFVSLNRSKFLLLDGVISISLALFLIFGEDYIGEHFIPYIVAFWVIFKGVVWVMLAIKIKTISPNTFLYLLAFGVLCVILGIIFVLKPEILAFLLSFVLGVGLIIFGIGALVFWKISKIS